MTIQFSIRNPRLALQHTLKWLWLVLLLSVGQRITAQVLNLPTTVVEGAGTITNGGNLVLGTIASSNIVFTLQSSDPSSLTVPVSVMIPTGKSNVLFNLLVNDNLVVDGDRLVAITAVGGGFPNLSNAVKVLDNDPARIRFGAIPSLTDTNSGLGVLLTAENADGSIQTNFNLSLTMIAEGLEGTLPIEPTNSGVFFQGQAYFSFQITSPGHAVRLRSLEYPGQSDAFTVVLPVFSSLAQPVADIAWHKGSQTLLATVPAASATYSNCLVAIDPGSGTVTNFYQLGADPGHIEMSPQGDYLYIALSGGRMLQRFDLGTRLARPPFALGSNSTSFRFAFDFCVPPGMSDSVVVEARDQDTLGNISRAGIFRYDNGAAISLPGLFASGGWRLESMSNAFEVAVCPPLVRSDASSGAIVATAPFFGGSEVSFRDGQLFDNAGNVYSPGSLALLGTYPAVLDQLYYTALPEVNHFQRRVFYLSGYFNFGSSIYKLKVYDRDLLQPLLQIPVPGTTGSPTRLLGFGSNGLAYVTGNNQLWFVRPDAVQPPGPATDLSLSMASLPPVAVIGVNYPFSLVLSNGGPGIASIVQVTNTLPPNTVVVQALPSNGSVTLTNGGFSWSVAPLPAGSNATLQLTLQFNTAGWQTNTAWALGFEADPVYTNNLVSLPLYVQLPAAGLGAFNLNYQSEDLLYDPIRDRLLVSVGSGLTTGQSNGLAVLNPYNGVTESFMPLGKRPSKLAPTDSGQYLYVSLPDDGLVRRFDMPSLGQNLEFQLGGEDVNGTWYPYYAADLSAVPGAPGSVVAWRVRRAGPMALEYGEGIALFQNGIMASNVTDQGGSWAVEFDTNTGTLFGFNSGDLRRCSLDSTGISFAESYPLFSSAGTDLKYSAGRFFTTSGRTVETSPFRLAWRFAGAETATLVAPDSGSGRVFYLVQNNGWQVNVYDSQQCRRLGSIPVPSVVGTPSSLIRWGTNGLAFRTSSNQIYIIRTPLVQPETSANLNLLLAGPTGPIPLGGNAAFTLSVTNQGPAGAVNLAITNTFSGLVTVGSVSGSAGAWSTNYGNLVWTLPSLDAGSQATLSYTVSSGQAGVLTVTAAAGFPGLSLGNNTAVRALLIGPAPGLDKATILQLQANGLTWSPSLGKLLLTSSTNNPNWGGALLTVDPGDLTVALSSVLGVDAGPLALSGDESILYAAVDEGVAAVQLPTLALTNRFLLNATAADGPAYDLKVVPGANNLLVGGSGSPGTIVVSAYNRGIQETNSDSFYSAGVSLQFGDDPSLLYCAGGAFRRYTVDSQGITPIDSDTSLLGAGTADLAWGAGRIYTSNGKVIDATTRTLAGSFAGIPAGSRVLYDAGSARVFYLCPGANQVVLQAFDGPTLLPIDNRVFRGVSGSLGPWVRWGQDGFAATTSGGQLLLFRTSLVPTNPPADVSVSLAHSAPPYLVGSNIVATLVISNAGPNATTDLTWKDMFPPGITVSAANSSTGTVVVTSNVVSGSVALLPPAATATVNITFTPPAAGIISNQVTASSSAVDPSFGNNSALSLLWIQPASGIAPITSLSLPVKDLERDPVRAILYASFGSDAGALADSVVALDPVNGNIGLPVHVGSNPGRLAASPDGQFLYVALDGAGSVQKLSLPGLGLLNTFPVRNNQTVSRMTVSPVDPQMVAIRRMPDARTSLHIAGIESPGELAAQDLFAFSSTTGQLFGCDGFHSNVKLYHLDTGPSGLALLESQPGKQSLATDLKSSGGLLFYDHGMVVDPQAGLVRALMPVPLNSLVEPDASVGRVFYATPAGNTWTLRAFDIQQAIQVGSVALPPLSSAPRRLLRWGSDGLALYNTNSQVLILRGQLVPPTQAADLVLKQSASAVTVSTNDLVTVSLQLTNLGPAAASSVVVTQTFSLQITNVVLTPSSGVATFTNSTALWQLGNVTTGTMSSLSVSFRARQVGTLTVAAAATHTANDLFWGNNVALNAINVTNSSVSNIVQLRLACRDLAYDSRRDLLYASTPAVSGLGGNLVAALNPTTGEMQTAFAAGSEPDKLALSDDGQFLYAALDGATGVRRFNLHSNTTDFTYPLTTTDINYALDLQVQPGHPRTVAAAVASYNLASPYPSDVLVHDDGTLRALKGGPARGIAFATDGAYLFGSISPGSGFGIVRMLLGPAGFVTDLVPGFTSLPGNLKFSNGRVYSSSGQVADPYAPALIGSVAGSGPQALDASIGRAFYLTQRGANWELRAFDLSTLQPTGTQVVANVQGTPGSLIRCGANRLAFCTTSNQLFLVTSSIVPTNVLSVANLSVSQQSVQDFAAPVETLRFSIQINNGGPGIASNILLAIKPPAPVASVSLDLPQGTVTNAGLNYLCSLGSLPSGQSLVVQLSATITNTAAYTNFVSVSAGTLDPDLSDNTSTSILAGHFFQRTNSIRKFSTATRALAYDPVRQFLFASLAAPGNQLAWFDVESGSVQGIVSLGISPDSLLVSDNGDYLYASAVSTGLVQRVYLPTRGLDLAFTPPGALQIGSMAMMPGNARSAAFTFYTTNSTVTAIFDDDVARPNQVFGMPFSLMSFATDAASLFGYANTGTGGNSPDVFRMNVSANGVTPFDAGPSDTPFGMQHGMQYASGQLFFENGPVLNASTWAAGPPFQLPNWGSGMSILSTLDRAAFLTSDFNNPFQAHVGIYSISGRQLLAQIDVSTTSPGFSNLVWCGDDRFAFITPTEIVFVRSSAIPMGTNSTPVTVTVLKGLPNPLLRIQGATGHWYSLESSSDLLNWNQVTNFYGSTPMSDVADDAAQGSGRHFYRAIQW